MIKSGTNKENKTYKREQKIECDTEKQSENKRMEKRQHE